MTVAMAVLAVVFVVALQCIFRGPDMANRLIGGQMAGGTGVAFMILLHGLDPVKADLDVILVMALLAGVTIIVFALEAPDDTRREMKNE
jgi:multisubunit Na+/H+ antiporter MnhF subunit